MVSVVSKAEDCVDFGNDTELFEVDLCAYVGGVDVLVYLFPAMIWTGVLLDYGAILLVNEVRNVVVLKMIWTDVVAGIIVVENVGLIEAGFFGVGWCTKVKGTCVIVLPVNIVVGADRGGARDDVQILVEFVAVTDVVIRDEVAFSVVKSICCRWCVVLISDVSNDSLTDGSIFLVKFLPSKCKNRKYISYKKTIKIFLFLK